MALWKCTIVIIVLYIWGCSSQSEDKVDQHTRIQFAFEGDTVKIDCTYQTAYTNPTLFWYQQKGNGHLKHMLNKFSKSGNSEEEFKERFHANLSTTSVPLTIKYLRVSDSAVYYCALRPTVTETHSTLIQKLKQCDIIMQFNLIYFLNSF
uniref:Ig-like domain-containing protein n=1 Tax=Cyprinus carpio carpio TaxID=630221 RepID=A0A9J7X604_CYPCA